MRRPQRSGPMIETLLRSGRLADAADDELLSRFMAAPVGDGDGAFEELLRRHGPMVQATCRALAGERHDAEDAFQATFLVLARDGASIRDRRLVGPWLHRVAVRLARRARKRAGRHRQVELQPQHSHAVAEKPIDEGLAEAIHQEIAHLPESLRRPVVLCCLEDEGYERAAERLGVSEPTLRGRLHRARRRLADRLRARGFELCALSDRLAPLVLLERDLVHSTFLLARRGIDLHPGSLTVLNLLEGGIMSGGVLKLASLALVIAGACVTAVVAQQGKPGDRADVHRPAGTAPDASRKEAFRSRDQLIRDRLARSADLEIPDLAPLEDFLKAIRKATAGPDDAGVPIYLDPIALQIKELSLTTPTSKSSGRLDSQLQHALRLLGLAYEIRDGFLMIDTREAIVESRLTRVEERLDRILDLLEKQAAENKGSR